MWKSRNKGGGSIMMWGDVSWEKEATHGKQTCLKLQKENDVKLGQRFKFQQNNKPWKKKKNSLCWKQCKSSSRQNLALWSHIKPN